MPCLGLGSGKECFCRARGDGNVRCDAMRGECIFGYCRTGVFVWVFCLPRIFFVRMGHVLYCALR